MTFKISYTKFLTYRGRNCFYCDVKVETIGIDRVDSKVGYELNNLVPCCSICNKMKWAFNQQIFINKCVEIAKIHGGL